MSRQAPPFTPVHAPIYGRCVALEPQQITLRNEKGVFQLDLKQPPLGISVGDIVEVENEAARLLTPNRTSAKTTHWMNRTLDPRRIRAISIRSAVEKAIRDFFYTHDFIETRTPLLAPCPGMEPHIRPFLARPAAPLEPGAEGPRLYLPTSPEFAMKRLLAGGLERIFQICPAFRDEPRSITHSPEFTILEWYRAYAGYERIMRDTEELFSYIATRLFGEPSFEFGGRRISVRPPWPRLKVRDLFLDHVGIDLTRSTTAPELARECEKLGLKADLGNENWDDLYFKIWLNFIEPALPQDHAVFVTRYPASQAALAVVDSDEDGSRWARRFEAYAGGIELGNAFEELTDPLEQRARFVKDMNLREEVYGPSFPKSPLDEGFLGALEEGIPPSGGIAMGVDRIVMLMADEPDIAYTQWLQY